MRVFLVDGIIGPQLGFLYGHVFIAAFPVHISSSVNDWSPLCYSSHCYHRDSPLLPIFSSHNAFRGYSCFFRLMEWPAASKASAGRFTSFTWIDQPREFEFIFQGSSLLTRQCSKGDFCWYWLYLASKSTSMTRPAGVRSNGHTDQVKHGRRGRKDDTGILECFQVVPSQRSGQRPWDEAHGERQTD